MSGTALVGVGLCPEGLCPTPAAISFTEYVMLLLLLLLLDTMHRGGLVVTHGATEKNKDRSHFLDCYYSNSYLDKLAWYK